jgi:hypothetical protein
VITGGLGLGGKSIAAVAEVEAFQLTVSISGYRHTLARFVDYPGTSAPCPVATEITLAESTEYKREDITAAGGDKYAKPSPTSPRDSSGGDQSKQGNP